MRTQRGRACRNFWWVRFFPRCPPPAPTWRKLSENWNHRTSPGPTPAYPQAILKFPPHATDNTLGFHTGVLYCSSSFRSDVGTLELGGPKIF
jgi:hypothetical protein